MSLYNASQWNIQQQTEPSEEQKRAEAERQARAAITPDEKDAAIQEAVQVYELRMTENAQKTAASREVVQLSAQVEAMGKEVASMLKEPSVYGATLREKQRQFEQLQDQLIKLQVVEQQPANTLAPQSSIGNGQTVRYGEN